MAASPVADGTALGFEEYVRTRQDSLLRSARRLVPDPVDAQDLVQTALCRTFPRWERIADKGLADAYMRRVMINTRTEWWRARKLDEVPTDVLPDASVDDGTEQHADRAMLLAALAMLAPKQRQVVVLRHWEQMSTEETARVLGMSTGTVKSTLHRALARLREELETHDELYAGKSGAGETAGKAPAATTTATTTVTATATATAGNTVPAQRVGTGARTAGQAGLDGSNPQEGACAA